MTKEELLKKANELPMLPGVYLMRDVNNHVIYVGKAKKLKNRVVSYFRNNAEHTEKTKKMVSCVDHFDVIITSSELNAFLTECSLIKKYMPLYNIAIKNGRGYPFIHFYFEEGFPVLTTTRFRKAGGKYFGPFLSRQKCLFLINLLSRAFKLPDCSIKQRKRKVCLQYSINRCGGFCEHKMSDAELGELYRKVCEVLEGNVDEIRTDILKQMEQAADKLDFEKAAALRDSARALESLANSQKAVVVQNRHADYIAYKTNGKRTCIFMLRIRNGYIVGERSDIFDEPFSSDLLQGYMSSFYTDDTMPPNKIYIPEEYDWMGLVNEWLHGKVSIPKLKPDKELLDNAHHNAIERMLQYEGRTQKGYRLLTAFSEFTGIENAQFMELYDISQLAGTDVVCGMVVCVDGILQSDRYRRFKLGKFDGNHDDTAYMQEAVTRRLERYRDGDEKFSPLPTVMICDGGLGQIHAVEEVVASFGYADKITVIGFKKDSRHRTKSIVFSSGKELLLVKNHEMHAFCGRLQESVHKYAIGYHRALRDEAARKSEILSIRGIGKSRAKVLFDTFKTVENIKKASAEDLMGVSGITWELAQNIRDYFEGEGL